MTNEQIKAKVIADIKKILSKNKSINISNTDVLFKNKMGTNTVQK